MFATAVHGGAGTLDPERMTPELRQQYLHALESALRASERILSHDGSALDAVQAAVQVLEDFPLFNAGRGAVFTHDKTHELDASIMEGQFLKAGAVAGIRGIANPVKLAREVMDHSDHVLLCGKGAEAFAQMRGFSFEPESYFYTDLRWKQLLEVHEQSGSFLDHSVHAGGPDKKFGTVGAVARDRFGNLAAATSTGGMTNKRWGRAGDSPIIGAGTYANNATCAISCTGHGEFFIRAVVAYDISCLMEYKGLSLEAACQLVVNDKLVQFGGEGGLVAVDAQGNVCLPFNSTGMYRGWLQEGSQPITAIY